MTLEGEILGTLASQVLEGKTTEKEKSDIDKMIERNIAWAVEQAQIISQEFGDKQTPVEIGEKIRTLYQQSLDKNKEMKEIISVSSDQKVFLLFYTEDVSWVGLIPRLKICIKTPEIEKIENQGVKLDAPETDYIKDQEVVAFKVIEKE